VNLTTNFKKLKISEGIAKQNLTYMMSERDSSKVKQLKKPNIGKRWWLTSVILAIHEAEIRRIMVRSQPQKRVRKT
jgi:hypothetical protein